MNKREKVTIFIGFAFERSHKPSQAKQERNIAKCLQWHVIVVTDLLLAYVSMELRDLGLCQKICEESLSFLPACLLLYWQNMLGESLDFVIRLVLSSGIYHVLQWNSLACLYSSFHCELSSYTFFFASSRTLHGWCLELRVEPTFSWPYKLFPFYMFLSGSLAEYCGL